MGKYCRVGHFLIFIFFSMLSIGTSNAQCTTSDILEPGFKFLTSSRGCAPFTVQIQTEYLSSNIGTVYYIDWGDGTPEEQYVQTTADGVIFQHVYPNSPIECGYDVIIDASNTCNPRGSVTPVETQVIVWTNDVIDINPKTFRVCQGFAESLQFTDNSDWNCFPRDTRENNQARWIQWIYGTGDATNRIPGINVNGGTPSSYPYLDPDPLRNPVYPVLAPGQVSLPIDIPVTNPADIGKEFEITLKNWNQCNPYDENIKDGDPRNPVNGDLVNGDNSPIVTTARVVIVEAPNPDFQTRAGDASGPLQNTFCIGDEIYFENLTASIAGADINYRWEFFNDNTGSGTPLSTSTDNNPIFSFNESGIKLVRMFARDDNAAGNCEAIVEYEIFISPLVQAQIGVTDLTNNPIDPTFCQSSTNDQVYDVRFIDESYGTITSDIRWKWEFYDENGTMVDEAPGSGGFSTSELGPFDKQFQQNGQYLVRLIILDQATGCRSYDSAYVNINESPIAAFDASGACAGDSVLFSDQSSSNSGITEWLYDFDKDGIYDSSFTSSQNFNYAYTASGSYDAQLVVTDVNGCKDSVTNTVEVNARPEAVISADRLSGCSELTINFTNESWDQSLSVNNYAWFVNDGTGFTLDSIQSPSDVSLDGTLSKSFVNITSADVTYEIFLEAQASSGCVEQSDTLTITVTPGASSGFLYTNYSPINNNCSPQEITFEVDGATQALTPNEYVWSIYNNDSLIQKESSGSTPSYSFLFENNTNTAQEYDINLETILSSECSSDSTLTVKINPVPSSDFIIDTLRISCEEMEIEVSAVQQGLANYNWNLDINNTSVYSNNGSEDSFTYLFNRNNADNLVDIRLQTTNLVNCLSEPNSKSITIPSQTGLNASFTLTGNTFSLPDATVGISNTSTAGDFTYLWDFGDGNSSNIRDVGSHIYTDPGTYLIQLTVSDNFCTSTFSEQVTITTPPPVAGFEYNPDEGCVPLTVNFLDRSQLATEYLWSFGDGDTSTLKNPTHTYSIPGSYSVQLTVKNEAGTDIAYKQNIITVYEPPVAYFQVRPNLVFVPDMPVYTNNLSEGATAYEWNFGDGTISNEFEPTHVYESPGMYDITLKVYNEFCTDSLTLTEAVEAKESGRLLVPNAFTPDRSGPNGGGGDNDVFSPLISNVETFKLQIYNRWGELLFEGVNRGWNGYYQGSLCPQDVYVYKIELTFNDGNQTTKVGDVNLIR